ncbi:lanthionine synthetase C family protein [Aquimarina sp. 2201CG14-23]|uniref:lanthionine synthetase C family protein n=1 Tax=Aquimarina mycalae TaxID=3040073 RepID=UPI0024780C14|nr:lanthionine synthetase C family protein [Aquimarina sp. 2201CG14-23]MDH7447401.1 lanthionine synthetase C family protein [Aquimarina sp. 2201CG14-23]
MTKEDRLLKKLEQINLQLSTHYQNNEHVGVLSGISGISLFHFYYSRYMENEQVADIGVDMISETIQRINDGYSFPTFCTGIAGAGWVLELLSEEEFIDIDNDDLLSSLDEYLFKATKIDVTNEYYDFLHGAIGNGYYFLKRYQNTKSDELKNTYKEYLMFLISALKKSSKKDNRGIWWDYELNKKEEIIGANLSLSHGMASIINFLCRLYYFNDFRAAVEELLQGSIDFIVHNKYEIEENSCLFPSWVYTGMNEYVGNRLAWCYGDLGLGISLWRAGVTLKNNEYQKLAIQTLKHAAKRKDPEEARIKDAGLCHGVFGIIRIFNYMFKETKEEIFKETADFWMDEALKMDIHENGHAGYMQWRGDLQEWNNEINLLEGTAGIGLSIISYLRPELTKWDECLMIS